jgi:hypothetical protein
MIGTVFCLWAWGQFLTLATLKYTPWRESNFEDLPPTDMRDVLARVGRDWLRSAMWPVFWIRPW